MQETGPQPAAEGEGQAVEEGWWRAIALADLPEAKAVRVDLGDDVLFLYRTADRIFALSNRCTHVGGPLNQGRVQKLGPQLTVTCPVHGSIFRLDDGRVLRGPASRPQPVYETRVNGDAIEVRQPAPREP
jgi:nitrite reductase/ring-hydroxylating ferredoxin subunit